MILNQIAIINGFDPDQKNHDFTEKMRNDSEIIGVFWTWFSALSSEFSIWPRAWPRLRFRNLSITWGKTWPDDESKTWLLYQLRILPIGKIKGDAARNYSPTPFRFTVVKEGKIIESRLLLWPFQRILNNLSGGHLKSHKLKNQRPRSKTLVYV